MTQAGRSSGYPLVRALNELGLWCKAVGRYAEGRRHYRRARRLLERLSPSDTESLATVYHNLAGVEHATGRYAAGEVLARKGLAIRLAGPRPSARMLAADLIALAAILEGRNRWDEAEALYLRGLHLLERLSLRQPAEEAVAWGGLGILALRRGRPGEALQLLARAVRLKRRALGPTHPDLGLALHNLAAAYRMVGREAAARAARDRAVAILEARLGMKHPWTRASRNLLEPCQCPAQNPDLLV